MIVTDTAKVAFKNSVFLLSPNELTFLPMTSRHRLEIPGKLPLAMIEALCGDCVGENDIVRFSDLPGRMPTSK